MGRMASLTESDVIGTVSSSLPDRHFDLYILGAVEHFAPQKVNEEIIMPSTLPHLVADLEPGLPAHFESAHSVMLAIIGSPPATADIGARILSPLRRCRIQGIPVGRLGAAISPRIWNLGQKILPATAYLGPPATSHEC
jgi:hypothetical protein